MNIPPSEHFTPVSLAKNYNVDRVQLDGFGGEDLDAMYGSQSILGLPFDLGAPGEPNGILLDGDAVRVDNGGVKASYVVFFYGVENRVSNYQDRLADFAMDGNELGDHVSDYVLEYEDGEAEATRFCAGLRFNSPVLVGGKCVCSDACGETRGCDGGDG